jgi:hypothetical protein
MELLRRGTCLDWDQAHYFDSDKGLIAEAEYDRTPKNERLWLVDYELDHSSTHLLNTNYSTMQKN